MPGQILMQEQVVVAGVNRESKRLSRADGPPHLHTVELADAPLAQRGISLIPSQGQPVKRSMRAS